MIKFIKLDKVESTILFIKKNLKSILTDNKIICVSADHQTKGTGRNYNVWRNYENNLMISYLVPHNIINNNHNITNKLKLQYYLLYYLLTELENFTLTKYSKNINLQYKFPNDIYYNNKKLSGIIIEINNLYTIMSFGVNMNNSDIQFTNLKEIINNNNLTTNIDKFEFLNIFNTNFINNFILSNELLSPDKENNINAILNNKLLYKNEQCKITCDYTKNIYYGRLSCITKEGYLNLITDTNNTYKIVSGSVSKIFN